MATIANNAQIKFKHGTQASLETLMTTQKSLIESGTFYLTRDTHRLYIGLSDDSNNKTLAPVNEGIVKYSTATFPDASIANMGQFAYIEGEGILCISNGKQWFQINPDTYMLYDFNDHGVSQVKDASNKPLNSVKFEINVKGTKNTDTNTNNESSGVVDTEKVSFTLTGNYGVIVEGSDKEIKVYGARLDLLYNSANSFTLQLKDKNNQVDSSVEIVTNANLRVKTPSESKTGGDIYLEAKDTTLAINDRSGGSALAQGFQIVAKDTDGNTSGGTIDPVIAFGNKDGKTTATAHFVNGTATLPVYTKDEIDALQLQFNAMNYKGVTESIPTGDKIQNGDTYKATAKFTYTKPGTDTPIQVEIGDIIIATGTEGTDGYIDSPVWDVVPSGNEDTRYSLAADTHGIILKETPLGKSASPIGSLNVKAGTAITSTKSGDDNDVIMTIGHANVSHTPTTDDALINGSTSLTYDISRKAFTAIVGLTVNEQGHVTGYVTRNITLVDTNAKLVNAMGVETKTSGNGATVTLTTTLDRSGDKTSKATGAFGVKSSNTNLTVTADSSNNITMNFVWETFGTN